MRHPSCRREARLSGYAKPVRFSANASVPLLTKRVQYITTLRADEKGVGTFVRGQGGVVPGSYVEKEWL